MIKNYKKYIGITLSIIYLISLHQISFADDFEPADEDYNASNTYILDADDTGGDVRLQFGDNLSEFLEWNNTDLQFDLSDDLNIDGGIEVNGGINAGFTNGSVIFSGASTLSEDNGNLFWDDGNNRLGIGTNNPNNILSVEGDASISKELVVFNTETIYSEKTYTDSALNHDLIWNLLQTQKTDDPNDTEFATIASGTGWKQSFPITRWKIGDEGSNGQHYGYVGYFPGDNWHPLFRVNTGGSDNTDLALGVGTKDVINITNSDFYVGIHTTSPSQILDVNGNARFRASIYDGNNQTGTSGQILSSTITGTDWIDVPIGNKIEDTDQDTKIQLEEGTDDDTIRFDLGGATPIENVLLINQTNGLIWNDGGNDLNLRLEGDNEENLLFLDAGSDRIGIGTNTPNAILDVESHATAIEIGDGTANDTMINFDDGNNRNFGWDDNYSTNHNTGTLSTYNNELAFRTIQSSNTPVACSSTVAGMQWMDTDTGILYICDTSNGRNKWLSPQDISLFGDESGSCSAGADPNSNANCNVDWGNGLGPDGSTLLGLYIPNNITITGYGFSEDNDACTSGSFDVEIWGTGANNDDNNYSLANGATIASGLTGETHNSNSLNVDVDGDQYVLWGLDNNCGQNIDDWNVILYYRYRN